MKTLSKKEIREQVVIGIFQFIGWILLGLFILGIIWGILYIPYSVGRDKGINEGFNNYDKLLIKSITEYNRFNLYDGNGTYLFSLEKEHSCSDSFYFGNPNALSLFSISADLRPKTKEKKQ